MVLIKLLSTNPKLGFIIFKNPYSNMQIRTIRHGNVYGYYSIQNGKIDTQEYNIYFNDSDSEISYKSDKHNSFEYINVCRYNSSMCVCNCINEFFSSTLNKNINEYDINGYDNKFVVTLIEFNINKSIIKSLMNCPDFIIDIKHKIANNYKIEISTNQSIHKLLTFCNVLFTLNAINNKEVIDINKLFINKLVKQIVYLDLDYYIRYFLNNNINPYVFSNIKNNLQQSKKYSSLILNLGNSQKQRKSFIDSIISFDKNIIDIGCGKGFYALPYSKKLKNNSYIAIDKDSEELTFLINKAKLKNIKNIVTFNDINNFFDIYNLENVNILITEVLEHLEKKDAINLLIKVYTKLNFDKIIITVPNKNFNINYPDNKGMRHPDHKWEPNKQEFLDFIIESISTYEKILQYKYYPVGDIVNDESISHGIVIKKNIE